MSQKRPVGKREAPFVQYASNRPGRRAVNLDAHQSSNMTQKVGLIPKVPSRHCVLSVPLGLASVTVKPLTLRTKPKKILPYFLVAPSRREEGTIRFMMNYGR